MFFKRNKNQVGGIAYQHVNADMATNIKLDTAGMAKSINELKNASGGTTERPKIQELPEWDQAKIIHANNHIYSYCFYINDPEIVALLNKPNTRLAIIEDDEDA